MPHRIVNFVNTSPFISGCLMLMMNLGGKYVIMEMPNGMHSFFANSWIRKLTILCISFIATRNIKTALLISLLFILFSRFLMNEKSKCCLSFIKKSVKTQEPENKPIENNIENKSDINQQDVHT
jgi:hypothetical protein